MKKGIISILVILPLLLVVIIAITGRIYGNVEYIKVESIMFVDTNGEELGEEITLEVGRTRVVQTVVNPILASNPNLTFSSSNSNYLSIVSSNQDTCVIKAIGVNETGKVAVDVTAHSIDGVNENLKVNIVQVGTSSIVLDHKEIEGYVGLKTTLNATTIPSSEAQNLIWETDNSDIVQIEGSGGKCVVSFKALGEATIKVKTKDGLEQECYVKVLSGEKPCFEGEKKTYLVEIGTIDLNDYVINANSSDIHFEIVSGNAILEGSKLTVENSGVVTIRLWSDDENLNYDEAKFLFRN